MNEEIKGMTLSENTNDTKQMKMVKRGVFATGENITADMLPYRDNFVEPDASDFDTNVDNTLKHEIEQLKNMGGLIPKNLTPLFLMEDGSGIFAKKMVSEDNESYIVLIYVYSDGRSSKQIRIDHSELHHISKGNYGKKNENVDKYDRALARKTLSKLENKILPYWRPTIDVPPESIVQMLFRMFDKLEVEHTQTASRVDIYKYIVEVAERGRNSLSHFYIVRRKYYAFTVEHFVEIAEHFNLTKEELIAELKEGNLLFTQGSSANTLSKVNGIGYCYCIKMMASRCDKVAVEDLSGYSYDKL